MLLCVAMLAGCGRNPHSLSLVTPLSPIDRGIVDDLSELFDDESRVKLELTREAMSAEVALDAIANGDADIALVTNNLPFRSDIATVMPLYPTVLHIAHRADLDAPLSPSILRGATVYAGESGSASRYVFDRIAERTGLVEGDYQYTNDPEDFPDVVVVFAPIAPDRISEFEQRLVLASIGSPEDVNRGGIIDAAVLLNPRFSTFVIPVGTYGDATPNPIVTVAVDKILVTRNDLAQPVVYDLINELLRLRPALAAKRPGLFPPLAEDFDASRSGFILHSGTQAYLQRSEPSVYERYSGIAEVVVTLLVATVSAAFAGVRILQRRRKNRIDRFYTRAIALGRSVNEESPAEEQQEVIRQVRELQDSAFDQLVDEKLSADESFRIFITLSDDILRRLGAPADHSAPDA